MTYSTLCALVRSHLLSSSALFVRWCVLTLSARCRLTVSPAKMVLSKDPRNKWVQRNDLMTDPRTNVKCTLMQLYTQGWQPGIPLCLLGLGNWLDPSVKSFMQLNNVKMIVKLKRCI